MELSDRQKEIIAQAKRSGASAPSATQQPTQTQAPEEDKGFIESIADRARMNLTDPERLKSKLRVLGQGMSFGTTDEAEAFVRSQLGGEERACKDSR